MTEDTQNTIKRNELCIHIHKKYISEYKDSTKLDINHAMLHHIWQSATYWYVMSAYLLQCLDTLDSESIIKYTMECYDEINGGFGGNKNYDSSPLHTLSAIQILAIFNKLDLVPNKVQEYLVKQCTQFGGFKDSTYGEVDGRYTYCIIASLSILNIIDKVVSCVICIFFCNIII